LWKNDSMVGSNFWRSLAIFWKDGEFLCFDSRKQSAQLSQGEERAGKAKWMS
jgi:hypothetical protein